MTRLLIIIFFLTSNYLFCQTFLTKDSFFLKQKSLPKDYKLIIKNSRWFYIGSWKSNIKKIDMPDTLTQIDLMLFEDKLERRYRYPNRKVVVTQDTSTLWETYKVYRRIEGNKIVSNTDFATEKIIYVDNSTLILETEDKKIIHRTLYRTR